MTTLNLGPDSEVVAQCRQAIVNVADVRRDDLCVLEWEVADGPAFGRGRIAQRFPSGMQASHLAAIGLLPPIGSKIRLEMEDGSSGEFHGIVAEHRLECLSDGVTWVAVVASELAVILSRALAGRLHGGEGGPIRVENAHVHFNSAPEQLASAEPLAVGGRTCRIFDGGADARRWTAADALEYLLATELPSEVACPSNEEIESLAGECDLGELNVTGKTLGEALAETAGRAGLSVRARREGLGIVFYRPGIDGRARPVSLQPAGAAFSPGATNLLDGQLRLGAEPPGVLAIGDYKLYEATLELKPGWDAGLESGRWADFVRSRSGDWQSKSDVYRRWVLNEHGHYSDEPWNCAPGNLSAISEDFKLAIARRFLPCVSCDSSGQSLGVVVEVRCGTGTPWRRWNGPAWVSSGECAIYLGGDSLPGDFFRSAAAGEAAVRVTATLRSDVRLTALAEGDASAEPVVVDCPGKAHWRAVHPSSIFSGGESSACDETAMLEAHAREHFRALAGRGSGKLTLAWIDTAFDVGDIVAGIDGQALNLSSSRQRCSVRAVEHDFKSQQTTLTIGG